MLRQIVEHIGKIPSGAESNKRDLSEARKERITKIINNSANRSKGLGDTVSKITQATGLAHLTELYTQITGKDCGCEDRQAALNKLFPYGITETE